MKWSSGRLHVALILAAGSKTVLAVGPGPASLVDQVHRTYELSSELTCLYLFSKFILSRSLVVDLHNFVFTKFYVQYDLIQEC